MFPREAENQDPNPQTFFELLRKQLLEQLMDPNQDIVHEALSQLEYEYVETKLVKKYGRDRYVEAKQAIGIKLSVRKELIELLNSASVDTREFAIRRLGELGPKADDALPKLRELLAIADSRTKLKAAEAVWHISGNAEESTTALVKLIRDDEEIGQYTVWTFELMGPAAFSAFEAIEGLSRDPRDKVRETATKILGSFGPKHKLATEAPLLARLTDTSNDVKIAACLSLMMIDGELEAAVETLISIVDQTIENNSATFRESPEENIMISAINALGLFGDEAVDAVLAISLHLNSGDLNVRSSAATGLGKIGPAAEKAIPLLAKAMRDTESKAVPLVHYVVNPGDDAAKALGSIGIAAAPLLLDSLNDPEVVVRIRAARELGRIQEAARQTVGPLTAKLSDLNAEVRLEAIKSLARLGKNASAAAPELTKFLFAAEALTSFPSGGGIGITERFSTTALRSLRSIEATEEQILPAILDALDRNQNLTLEAISVLRQYPNRGSEFENPLRRLLDGKNLGGACALAAFGANDSEIQAVLAKNLFEGEQVNSVAALGIGQLVAHGVKLDEAVSSQLSVAIKKEYVPLSIWTILLRLTPDDKAIVASFMTEARLASPFFGSEIEIEEAEAALVELIHHKSVQDALEKDLDNRADLIRSRFLSARILIAANQKQEQAFACLEREAAVNGDLSAFLDVADFLGKLTPSEPSKSLLVKLLQCQDGGVVHGDFYGRGGELRIVGDRAALALVRQKEVSTLIDQLGSKSVMVRLRVVRALGGCGLSAFTPELLELARDSEKRVRLEVIRTLGRIGLDHPETRNELRPALETATKDRRRSISDEAHRTLNRWR